MLTDAAARAAKGRDRPFKLADSGRLHLYVLPSGSRSWRMKHRYGGKQRQLVFGNYPDVGIRKARDLRDDAKQLLR